MNFDKLSPKVRAMYDPPHKTAAIFSHINQLTRLDEWESPRDNAKLWKARAVKLAALRAIIQAFDDTVDMHHEVMNSREGYDYDRYEAQCEDWEASIDMIDNLDNALGCVWDNLGYETQKNVANPKPLKANRYADGTEAK